MQTGKPLTREAEEQLLMIIQRMRANLLGFPHLCIKTLCRRADKCLADPDMCMARFAPLVSEDVRSGVDALVMGKFDGLSYDEVRESAPSEVRAYEEWLR